MDWESAQASVRRTVRQQGHWYGLGDGDGNPLWTLPQPVTKTSPEQWMEATDLSITIPATHSDGTLHPVTKLLVMDELGNVDPSGKLPAAQGDYTLLFATTGPDGEIFRTGGVITHVDADDPQGTGMPETVTIHALSVADAWHTVVAASWPAAWWKATPYEVSRDEAGVPFGHSWQMAAIELASRATFTLKQAQAGFVVRRLAQESLDACMFAQHDPDGTRWVDDQYHVVEVPEVDTTPEISLTVRDESVWDTVVGQAKNAGLILTARIWWPGDKPVRCWSPVDSSMPPEQVDISPSEGRSFRTVGERSFEHAMIVLVAKEVEHGDAGAGR